MHNNNFPGIFSEFCSLNHVPFKFLQLNHLDCKIQKGGFWELFNLFKREFAIHSSFYAWLDRLQLSIRFRTQRSSSETAEQPERWAGDQENSSLNCRSKIYIHIFRHWIKATWAHFPLFVFCLQSEPEDHVGARALEGGARETQNHWPGEEPQMHELTYDTQRTAEIWVVYAKKLVWYANAKICLQGDAGQKGTGQTGSQRPGGDSGWSFCSVHERCFLHLHIHVCTLWFLSSPQAKELQTLHNLRKLLFRIWPHGWRRYNHCVPHSSLNYSR